MNSVKLNVFYSDVAKEKIASLTDTLQNKIQNYFDELSSKTDSLSKSAPRNTEKLINGFFSFRLDSIYRVIYNVEQDSIFVTDLLNYNALNKNLISEFKPNADQTDLDIPITSENQNRQLEIETEIAYLEKLLRSEVPAEKVNYNSFTLVSSTTLLLSITHILFNSSTLRTILELLTPFCAFIINKIIFDYLQNVKQKRFESTIEKMIDELKTEKKFK